MAEKVELIIKTAGDGMLASCRSIPCGPHQQIILRFMNGDSVVFTGERFSPEEYNKYCGEVDGIQTPPAINQPIRNLSDELMDYAKKIDFFGAPVLERIKKLEPKEQLIAIADEVMYREGRGLDCPQPPQVVIDYIRRQGSYWEDFV